MNCKSVQNRLSAYLDRELGGDELLQMRAHMSVCSDCRKEAEGLRVLKSLLGGIHCPEPPADLAERLTANMLRQRYEEPRKTFRVSAVMFAGITACSMFATLLALNYVSAHHGPSSTNLVVTKPGTTLPQMDGPDSVGITAGFTAGGPTISAANFGFR